LHIDYHWLQLYNYCSFDEAIYEKVVNYIHLDQHIDEFIVCGLKSAYILKDTSEAFKKEVKVEMYLFLLIDDNKNEHPF
jgi:hypothetical protein